MDPSLRGAHHGCAFPGQQSIHLLLIPIVKYSTDYNNIKILQGLDNHHHNYSPIPTMSYSSLHQIHHCFVAPIGIHCVKVTTASYAHNEPLADYVKLATSSYTHSELLTDCIEHATASQNHDELLTGCTNLKTTYLWPPGLFLNCIKNHA